MKFYNINDLDGFFHAVEQCEGRVELVTNEGDRLNLKSQLSRVVAYANVFGSGKIKEMEILTSNPSDMHKLLSFVVSQDTIEENDE